jgi:hypothetical protein
MSDLQILTGISILISGYAQLRCGLSCYHWQLLVYLAWFSNLTNLACLTFLRHYLYIKPGERARRLIFIGFLALLLIVAMIPTGNYNWTSGFDGEFDHSAVFDEWERPQPTDYAICYFRRAKYADSLNFASMIISVLLVIFGFMARVVRLHKSLSIDIVGRARRATSERLRAYLRKIYNWCDVENSPNGLRRVFIYRPLLAIFVVSRVCLDAWSSMFIEVSKYLLLVLSGISLSFLLRDRTNDSGRFAGVLALRWLHLGYTEIVRNLHPIRPRQL